tara:strand:+ start:474 stop:1241 length:768 start_codon:yes stop_codon:yes gene_type:complete
MLIDFHCHTKDSFDAYTTYDELLKVCVNKNISAITITEHDLPSKAPLKKFKKNNISIIPGCEFTTDKGAHIIGLFIKNTSPKKNDLRSIIDYISQQDGIIYIPHPFKEKTGICKVYLDYELYLNHCNMIEIVNGGLKESEKEKNEIKKIANQYNLILVSGSDSHKASQVGYYLNKYNTDSNDLYDIVKNLSPTILYDSNLRRPPRNLNFLQKTSVYQFMILKVNYKFKRIIKKIIYKLFSKTKENEKSNYIKLNL